MVMLAVPALGGAFAESLHVTPVPALPSRHQPLPASIGGRTQNLTYQWPGVYFEATFAATSVYFSVGPGDAILHVSVDVKPVASPCRRTVKR